MDKNQIAEKLREIANDSKDAKELRDSILSLADGLDGEAIAEEARWETAIENARFMLEEYMKIPSGTFGTVVIALAISRYDNGERTKELLEELEGIQ